MEMDYTAFRENLQTLIESRGLTRSQLAEDTNIKKATLSRYLNGLRAPELAYVVKISQYFKVSVDWILGLSTDKYGTPGVTDELSEMMRKYSIADPNDRTIIDVVLRKYEGK